MDFYSYRLIYFFYFVDFSTYGITICHESIQQKKKQVKEVTLKLIL